LGIGKVRKKKEGDCYYLPDFFEKSGIWVSRKEEGDYYYLPDFFEKSGIWVSR
jgi:hypothetical protein